MLGGTEVQTGGALTAHGRVPRRRAVVKELAVAGMRHQCVVPHGIALNLRLWFVIDATLWNIIRTLLSFPVTKNFHLLYIKLHRFRQVLHSEENAFQVIDHASFVCVCS